MSTSSDASQKDPEPQAGDESSQDDRSAAATDKASQGAGTPSSNWRPPSRRAANREAARTGPDADVGGRSATSAPPIPLTQQIGRAVVVLLAIAFGVFAVANSQFVDFSWIFGGTTVMTDTSGARIAGGIPLIVLLVTSACIGVLVGSVITWQASRSRRRRREAEDS